LRQPWARLSRKEAQYLIEHAIARHIPADERFKDISVADLPDAAQSVLGFHPEQSSGS